MSPSSWSAFYCFFGRKRKAGTKPSDGNHVEMNKQIKAVFLSYIKNLLRVFTTFAFERLSQILSVLTPGLMLQGLQE